MKKENYFALVAFMGGLSIMAIKVLSSRLLAPYFGTSFLVWTNILGIIMIALSLGYYFGGRIADRFPSKSVFSKLVFFTGLYIGCIPFGIIPLTNLALKGFDNYQIIKVGIALGIMSLLLSLPFVALGMFIPYVVKLQTNQNIKIGKLVGNILAWSAIGGIVGTLSSTLITIHLIGTSRSILLFSTCLMLISIIDLKKWFFFLPPLTFIILTAYPFKIKHENNLIYETESTCGYIQVFKKEDGLTILKLNEGQCVHSYYHPDRVLFYGEWDYSVLGALLNRGKSLLVIGLGAGTSSRIYSHFIPGTQIDGVEIDPAIVNTARLFFGLNDIPNLNVITQDGRLYLSTTVKTYDNITIDAYQQPYIPFHLATKEFFEEIKKHLNPGGIVQINVGCTDPNATILLMILNTMKSVFKYVYKVEMYKSLNYCVWASDYDYNLYALDVEKIDEALRPLINYIKNFHESVEFNPNCIVLKDDMAPVEWYTEKMIIDYAKKQLN